MKKSWYAFAFLAAAIVMVVMTLNYNKGKDAVPLSEIFPEEETMPVETEYEFVQEETAPSQAQKTASAPQAVQPTTADAPKENVPSSSEIVMTEQEANFTIQIASFKDQKKADEALVKIRKNVPSAYIGSRNLGDKGIWYRIYTGQFKLRSEAEVTLRDIKQNYNDSFIISPKQNK